MPCKKNEVHCIQTEIAYPFNYSYLIVGALIAAINQIVYHAGGTRTAEALDFVRKEAFKDVSQIQ